MTELVRPDLVDRFVAVAEHVQTEVRSRGWTTEWGVWTDADSLHFSARGVTEASLTGVLDTFDPAAPLTFELLPDELRAHVAHIRDWGRMTDAQLTAATQAQARHVLRDVCRALALLVDTRLD